MKVMSTGNNPTTDEEAALKAIWDYFEDGRDWGNALRVLNQYGHEQRCAAYTDGYREHGAEQDESDDV